LRLEHPYFFPFHERTRSEFVNDCFRHSKPCELATLKSECFVLSHAGAGAWPESQKKPRQSAELLPLDVDKAEGPRLRAVAIDRDILAFENLDNEVRHDASVVRVHARAVGIKMRTTLMSMRCWR
jgi:hypothetical protein